MIPIAPGLDYLDLNFLGQSALIATGVIHGSRGVALIDPGPSTTLPSLRAAMAGRGLKLADVRAILLTHIHLDHAGATGTLLLECPDAIVYVHERGAPHIIDPSKLLASASRLYVGEMDRLWGEVRAIPASRVNTLGDRDELEIVGRKIESIYTPGHASHHVSYFVPDVRMAFVGDTAGICRTTGGIVLPPTPPPDIDLEAWRASTDRILSLNPDALFLTHFGPYRAPQVHLQELWRRMNDWSSRVRALLEKPGTDEERSRVFTEAVTADISRESSRAEAEAYMRAARFDFSWAGLSRYWLRKTASTN